MFAPFSSGYYVGRLVIEPHAGETALLHREIVERMNEELYATGDGIERIDYPLFMKLWHRHFAVHGADGVPEDTLLVPSSMVADDSSDPLPGIREVLLAKPTVIPRILEWIGREDDMVLS